MPGAVTTTEKGASRKLRAHKKSRRGCGNCKLRAVKCDESRPVCKRCKAYGVVCNYDRKSPDLELSTKGSNGVFQVSIINNSTPPSVPKSIAPSLKQGLAASLASHASRSLNNFEFELLHRFQTRTVFTVTTPRSLPVYESSILKHACSHPYLLHAVLTLTLLHDRHFSPTPFDTSLSTIEAHQWGQCISLYNRALSSPILPASRDALWVTAAFLGILAIAHVDARTPEESWPYAPPSPMDLNWLRMSDGKKEIWKDGKAFMQESDFRILALELRGNYAPGLTFGSEEGLKALPPDFLAYFDLLEGSDLVENPYTAPVFSLAQTWKILSMFNIILNFIFCITNMESRYKLLLAQKDPRALLLLAYWWRMIADTQHWHMFRRAIIECQSICLYLEREYREDHALQSLLTFPKGVRCFSGI
ncbi:related to UPC2-regulatory protein involved in control of sterol uptake [Phialocephala subalpina]|uniref:Related to UPC2-regulatory protein involved in control of sterol uptake n=1 Tax=Phialocephala subalpina TaxID=576137 RepID=A0A1L7XL80_9HELO|nr:related to UPC2-regulatory protein involved in control of sterol uptake [Phialocephala subalpina]